MDKNRKNRMVQILEAKSPSGFEYAAKSVYKKQLEKIATNIIGDSIGNTIAILKPKKAIGSIMLAGHIDEIALMVKYIDDKGFVFVSPVGGVDPAILPGKRVKFLSYTGKEVLGIIGKKPIHLMDAKDEKKAVKFDDLFIDIGAKDKKEAEKMLMIGDTGVIDYGVDFLGDDFAVSRAFDDRIGAFIIAEVLRELKKDISKLKYDVYGVATVQEEVGLRGATVASYNIKPDLAIALDVTHAIDYPDVNPKKFGDIKLGNGSVIVRGPNIHPFISKDLIQIAEKKKIPYQVSGAPKPTGTDANIIQIMRGGIPVALVSIPLRYMHTPSEMLSLKDIDNIIKLLKEFILSLNKKIDFNI